MRLSILGILGIIGSFFMAIEGLLINRSQNLNSSVGGACELIYMLGWMCSIYGLKIIHADAKRWIRNVLSLELIFLTLANTWNTWNIFDPNNLSPLYFALDMFWPVSNLFMIVVGIAIMKAGILQGWKRYIPLIVGLWFPLGLVTWAIAGKEISFIQMDLYSIVCWGLMGFVVLSSKDEKRELRVAF